MFQGTYETLMRLFEAKAGEGEVWFRKAQAPRFHTKQKLAGSKGKATSEVLSREI